ncbi:MAG: LptA/OstA family protein [Planctomycetota bacterium]
MYGRFAVAYDRPAGGGHDKSGNTGGFGLLVALTQIDEARAKPGRDDRMVIGRQITTTIRGTRSGWLLRNPPPAAAPPAAQPGDQAPQRPGEAPKGDDEDAQPIVVTCSGPLTFHREDAAAVYDHNVRAAYGDQTLTCETLTIAFHVNAQSKQVEDFDSVTASGTVRIDNGQDLATADVAVWHRRDGLALLTGCPATVTWDNGNELVAGRIRRKTRIVRAADPETGRVEQEEVLDWLDCTPTADCPRSVYLKARTATPLASPETPHASSKAPDHR